MKFENNKILIKNRQDEMLLLNKENLVSNLVKCCNVKISKMYREYFI